MAGLGVVGRDNFGEEAPQTMQNQEARERAVYAACVLAQNGAALTQELKVDAPVLVYNTASEETSNSKMRLQFRPRTTSACRGGEPPSPGRRINVRASPNAASSKEHPTRTRMLRA